MSRAKRKEGLERALYRFRRNRLAIVGLIIIAIEILAALLAPVLAPYPEDAARMSTLASSSCFLAESIRLEQMRQAAMCSPEYCLELESRSSLLQQC